MNNDFKVKDINQQNLEEKKFLCRNEMPGLMALRKEFKGKNL